MLGDHAASDGSHQSHVALTRGLRKRPLGRRAPNHRKYLPPSADHWQVATSARRPTFRRHLRTDHPTRTKPRSSKRSSPPLRMIELAYLTYRARDSSSSSRPRHALLSSKPRRRTGESIRGEAERTRQWRHRDQGTERIQSGLNALAACPPSNDGPTTQPMRRTTPPAPATPCSRTGSPFADARTIAGTCPQVLCPEGRGRP